MSIISLQDALNYLDTFREFVIDNDIPKAIEGKAIYLAALGLSTYTEILGGLYCGDLSGKNWDLSQHYISFINEFFHPDYAIVDENLRKDHVNGLYGAVGSGLAHEYFIKKISKIEIDSPYQINCGIAYDHNKDPQIVFYVKQHFQDFKNAFEKYYDKLKTDQSGNLLGNFENALCSINSSLIGRTSGNFGEDVSGKSI
jgi:hypothetical protein